MFVNPSIVGGNYIVPDDYIEDTEKLRESPSSTESAPVSLTLSEPTTEKTAEAIEEERLQALLENLEDLIQRSPDNEPAELEAMEQLVASSEKILELVNTLPEVVGDPTTRTQENILTGMEGSEFIVETAAASAEALSKFSSVLEMAGEASGNVELLIKLGSLFVVGKAVLNINAELATLNSELETAQADLRKFEPGGPEAGQPNAAEEKKKIEDKITTLNQRIDELKEGRTTLCKETSIAMVKASIKTARDDLGLAGSASSTSAVAAQHLALAGGILGMVTGVASFGISLAGMVESYNQLKSVDTERAALIKQLESKTIDPAVKEVIILRLKYLEEQAEKSTVSSMQNFIAIVSSSLGITAGTAKVLILAGVGVAAGTAGAAAVVGIGSGAIAAGLITCALGYAAYKNRDVIKASLGQASLAVQEKWTQINLERERETLSTKLSEKFTAIEDAEKDLQECSQKVKVVWKEKHTALLQEKTRIRESYKGRINAHYEKLERIRVGEERVGGLMGTIKEIFGRKLTERETVQSYQEKQEAALVRIRELNEMAHRELTALDEGFKAFEDQVHQKMTAKTLKIEELTASAREIGGAIEELNRGLGERLDEIRQQKQDLDEELASARLSVKFANVIPGDVKEIAAKMRTLLKSPESKAEVEKFMRSQGFIDLKFEEEPANTVFKFLTRKPQEAKKEVTPVI
jgi:hypothetical protein